VDFFTISYNGDVIHVPDLPHHIPNAIRASGAFYEEDLLEHLRTCVRHGGTWVDVGANIGNHTIYFSRYTADRVVSLEPHPETFHVLTATLRKNGLANVCVKNVGASDHVGGATLALPAGFDNNPGSFRMTESGDVSIRVETLDLILADTPEIRLIKVDVEGHELAVIRGAGETIRRHRPDLVVEAHTDEDRGAILNMLRPLGYRVIGRYACSPTYHFAPWSAGRLLAFRARLLAFRAAQKWRHVFSSPSVRGLTSHGRLTGAAVAAVGKPGHHRVR